MAKAPDDPRAKAEKRKRPAGKLTEKPDRTRTVPTTAEPAEPSARAGKELPATPVMIRAEPMGEAVTLPASREAGQARKKSGKRAPARRPPRQIHLVAATLTDDEGRASLGVYAVVTRTHAEALAAVRDLLGADVPVGLTGKLSGRMAKALELRPGQVRRL